MTKKLSISTITAGDIKRRHPRYLTCETDKQYAQLANDIYEMIHDDLLFMEEVEIRNACISLALYFEDLRSETLLFETFTQLYQQMFGMYVPFYYSADGSEASASLDAMRFTLWHSIVAERGGRIVNPTNDGLGELAVKLLAFWNKRKDRLESNEDLADYLYAEETQKDVNLVKTVLVWLSQRSFLGRWFNSPAIKNNLIAVKQMFPSMDKDTLEYANECFTVFENQTWPLSLDPRHVYAEMIRIDMDDPNDEMAETIEHIEYKPFGIYLIVENNGKEVKLQDFLGDIISVSADDFLGDVHKLSRQNTHYMGSFLAMNGRWKVNGPSLWIKADKKHYQKYLDEERQKYHVMHDFVGQYDEYISKHDGRRMFFFPNVKGMMAWMKDSLGIDTSALEVHTNAEDYPQAIFFEDNGQLTMSPQAKCIKHPDNPYYDQAYAKENALSIVVHDTCSPGMLLYCLEHDLLPDALFNDIRGTEHGRQLAQENLEFVARCMRRDIKSEKVFRKRTGIPLEKNETDYSTYGAKLPYEIFVEKIAEEKTFFSKARKEWRVVRANKTTTVVRDVSKRQNYEIPTQDLYKAHLNLEEDDIQISNVAPFVGKQNASAASALLYNVVGRGQIFSYMRKHYKELFKNLNH